MISIDIFSSFFTHTAVQLAAWAAFNNVDIDNPLAPNGLPLRDWVCGSSAGDAIPNFEGNETKMLFT